MERLCTNRPEGFGPMSDLTPRLPTQCFFDTILAPLPTWLFLLSLPAICLVSWRRRRHRRFNFNNYLDQAYFYPYPLTSSDGGGGGGDGAAAAAAAGSETRNPHRSAGSTLPLLKRLKRLLPSLAYYGTVGVILLMHSVEIVQLARASLGVGLLPMVYVGAVTAALLRRFADDDDGLLLRWGGRFFAFSSYSSSEAVSSFWVASVFLWTAGTAVTALKLVALVTGLGGGDSTSESSSSSSSSSSTREAGPYPVVHQSVDLLILATFYALAAAAEVGMTLRRAKKRREAGRGDGGIEEDAVQLRESFFNNNNNTNTSSNSNNTK